MHRIRMCRPGTGAGEAPLAESCRSFILFPDPVTGRLRNSAGTTRPEEQTISPWSGTAPPRRVLIIRFHALGDVAVTFPASAGLRLLNRSMEMDFLTMAPALPLVETLQVFDRAFALPAYTRTASWAGKVMRMAGTLHRRRYDVILDLQRNWISRTIRRLASPEAWGEFDRFAPRPAADRVLETFHNTGFPGVAPSYRMPVLPRLQTAAGVSPARTRMERRVPVDHSQSGRVVGNEKLAPGKLCCACTQVA